MRNGGKSSGKVNSDSINFLTTYGTVRINLQYLMALDFENKTNPVARMQGKKTERLSGFLLDESFNMKQAVTDFDLKLRREKLRSIVFQVSEKPSISLSDTQFEMSNGDSFWGAVKTTAIRVKTDFASLAVPVEKMKQIEFVDSESSVSKTTLRGGDTLSGVFEDEDILVSVMGDEAIQVYRNKFEKITFPE